MSVQRSPNYVQTMRYGNAKTTKFAFYFSNFHSNNMPVVVSVMDKTICPHTDCYFIAFVCPNLVFLFRESSLKIHFACTCTMKTVSILDVTAIYYMCVAMHVTSERTRWTTGFVALLAGFLKFIHSHRLTKTFRN